MILIGSCSLSSCNKKKHEEVIACTDPYAINYNPNATSIPGSDWANCIYDSSCSNIIIIPLGNTVNFPSDFFSIDSAYLLNNIVHIKVTYGGGCENHIFNLYSESNFCATPPCYINFKLSHNSNNDGCFALLTENLCFDVSTYISDDNYLSLFDPENNSYINFY